MELNDIRFMENVSDQQKLIAFWCFLMTTVCFLINAYNIQLYGTF